MSEGLLHKGKIWEDVTTMDASNSSAVGAGGGFPCQAGDVFSRWFSIVLSNWLNFSVQTSIVCQGVSCGGLQEGLNDDRSALVVHTFRTYDSLPRKQRPCSQYSSSRMVGQQYIWETHRLARKVLYLENVASLLSKKEEMRTLFHYVIQVRVWALRLIWSVLAISVA